MNRLVAEIRKPYPAGLIPETLTRTRRSDMASGPPFRLFGYRDYDLVNESGEDICVSCRVPASASCVRQVRPKFRKALPRSLRSKEARARSRLANTDQGEFRALCTAPDTLIT